MSGGVGVWLKLKKSIRFDVLVSESRWPRLGRPKMFSMNLSKEANSPRLWLR